jgi:predicted Holliday junction resolvase-like endonuclease
MRNKSKLALTILSALVLLLVVVNIIISLGNQSIQSEVGERQQAISQTLQLEGLNRQLINVLANLALKTNDEALKKVLAAGGIDLSGAAEPAPAAKK